MKVIGVIFWFRVVVEFVFRGWVGVIVEVFGFKGGFCFYVGVVVRLDFRDISEDVVEV